jgi:heparan-alpha-glucosaminide N-acetyltransferase
VLVHHQHRVVTLSGCGLAFAYRNRVGWAATLRRSIVLLLCGLAFNAVEPGSLDPAGLKWTGPLQVYAVLVLVIGLLHLVARGPGAWALIAATAANGDEVLLYVWQQGCPGLVLTPECNPLRGHLRARRPGRCGVDARCPRRRVARLHGRTPDGRI